MNLKATFVLIVLLALQIGCINKDKKENESKMEDAKEPLLTTIKKKDFEDEINGKEISIHTIKNRNGIEATFTNYGQRLVTLYTPDKQGNFDDIVLGFETLEGYRKAEEKYFGATIGRYGNRIAKGKFSIDGQEYTLATNNGANHLHGGDKGFESVVWNVDKVTDNEIEFSRLSPDMEEGYPGNLMVKVNFQLTADNELIITYEAETDQKTTVNLTHHSFFNLKGNGNGTVNEHLLTINANYFTPVNSGLIPTGEIRSVEGTPFDFNKPKPIGQDLEVENEQLKYGMGYDHNFVLNENSTDEDGLLLAAKVLEPKSGRTLEVFTDEPGLQFYGGNFLKGNTGKSGKKYDFRGAFCLETQHFPDSPNQENFPSTMLLPGDKYTSTCVYKFGVE